MNKLLKNFRWMLIILFSLSIIACGDDDDDGDGGGSGGGTELTAALKGRIIVMTFDFLSTGETGPVAIDTDVEFTFSSSGSLFINLDNTGLSEVEIDGFSEVGSEFVWEDDANNFKYTVSLNDDDSIHEINVSLISDDTFIGQFDTLVSDSSDSSGGGSGSGTNGLSFTVDGTVYSFNSFIDQSITYGKNGNPDTVVLRMNATDTFRIPLQLGDSLCFFTTFLDGFADISASLVGADACSITVTSVSPLEAIFSGKVLKSTVPFSVPVPQTDLTNGTFYLDTDFVTSNSSTIDEATAFSIAYGGTALDAATCDPSVLVTPTASTLLGGNSDVYGWTGDADETGAFFEFSLNKSGNTPTPGQVNLRFVCSNLSVSWQTTGTLESLGISLDTSEGLVNFNNTVMTYTSTGGAVTNGFPSDTTIIPASSLSITLNGTLAEI